MKNIKASNTYLIFDVTTEIYTGNTEAKISYNKRNVLKYFFQVSNSKKETCIH